MNPATLTAAAKSAEASHAALVTIAKASTGAAAEQAWRTAGTAHRQAANLRMMLVTNERRTTT